MDDHPGTAAWHDGSDGLGTGPLTVPSPEGRDEGRIEDACRVMHDAYEAAAVGFGWDTNPRSAVPWADVPDENKATMRAAVKALLAWLDGIATLDVLDPVSPEGRDEGLREQLVEAVSWAETTTHGRLGYEIAEAAADAVLAVVSPALAQAEAERDEAEAHHGRVARDALYLESERDEARAALAQRGRVIAAVTALCDEADAEMGAGRSLGILTAESLRAALASGDGTGETGHTEPMTKPNEKNTADRPPVDDEDGTAAASSAELPPVTTEYVNPDDKVERDSVDEDKTDL